MSRFAAALAVVLAAASAAAELRTASFVTPSLGRAVAYTYRHFLLQP